MFIFSLGFFTPVIADCPEIEVKCWGSSESGYHDKLCGTLKVTSWYDWGKAVCTPCMEGKRDGRQLAMMCTNAYWNCCTYKPLDSGSSLCWVLWKGWQGSACGYYVDRNWNPRD